MLPTFVGTATISCSRHGNNVRAGAEASKKPLLPRQKSHHARVDAMALKARLCQLPELCLGVRITVSAPLSAVGRAGPGSITVPD